MDSLLLLNAQIQGGSAWLWVNGVVIGLLEPGNVWSQSIHQYLLRGQNQIRIQRVGGADFLPKADVHVSVQIQLLGKDKTQTLHRWNACHPGMKWVKAGCFLQVEADLPVQFPRWKFFDIQHMKSEPSDVVCIQYFLPDLINAILKRDFAVLHHLFSIRNKELCTAYGLDPVEFSDQFKTRVSQLSCAMEEASFQFNPLDCVCIPIGNSPLYYLSNKLDRPFLNWGDAASAWSIPLHVAVVQRQVYVIR